VATKGFEELDVYKLAEEIADTIWDLVQDWPDLARETMARQVIRAADSIGANIAEGSGRSTYKDNAHFACNARGSLYEVRHFLRRAYKRELLTQRDTKALQSLVAELGPKLNGYIRSLRRRANQKKPK
jgi:four helix bundle protein